VLLRLAILTGFPQEGTVILRELLERDPEGSWWEFVEGLAAENLNRAVRGQEWSICTT
jgi:hypothetical protein